MAISSSKSSTRYRDEASASSLGDYRKYAENSKRVWTKKQGGLSRPAFCCFVPLSNLCSGISLTVKGEICPPAAPPARADILQREALGRIEEALSASVSVENGNHEDVLARVPSILVASGLACGAS